MRKILVTLLISVPCLAQESKKVDVLDLSQIDLEQEDLDLEELERLSDPANPDELNVEDILEPSGDYQYSSFGRQDPFSRPPLAAPKTPDLEVQTENPEESAIPMVSPLQAYPLEQLEVKGVWVHRSGETRAVVMTPKKEGVVIKQGDPISAGKVIDINRNRVIVRQYSLRADGTREYKDIEMPIGNNKKKKKGFIRLKPGEQAVFDVVKDDAKPKPVVPVPVQEGRAPAAADPLRGLNDVPTPAPGANQPIKIEDLPPARVPANQVGQKGGNAVEVKNGQ